MKEILLQRENNYIINKRPLKIFIDDKFIDYIEPSEKNKKIIVENGKALKIKVNSCGSNVIDIYDSINIGGELKINIVSQVQNGFYVFAMISFISSFILHFSGVISAYLGMAMIIPFFYVAYWYTLGRKYFLRLTKK